MYSDRYLHICVLTSVHVHMYSSAEAAVQTVHMYVDNWSHEGGLTNAHINVFQSYICDLNSAHVCLLNIHMRSCIQAHIHTCTQALKLQPKHGHGYYQSHIDEKVQLHGTGPIAYCSHHFSRM